MPFIQPDLGLTNTHVGLISGALSLTWSLAAFGIGAVSDRTGSRKGLLVLATLAFSVCSFGSGLATSFAMLLGARLLMGVAEGGIMPISQSLIASEVDARHRGPGDGSGAGTRFEPARIGHRTRVAGRLCRSVRVATCVLFLAGAPGLARWRCCSHGSFESRSSHRCRRPSPRPFTAASLRLVLAERNVLCARSCRSCSCPTSSCAGPSCRST